MGKRKGKVNHDKFKHSERKKKRQKRSNKKFGRFWVEQCKDRKVPKNIPPELIFPLLISRAELNDNHTHAGKCSNVAIVVDEDGKHKCNNPSPACASTTACEANGEASVIDNGKIAATETSTHSTKISEKRIEMAIEEDASASSMIEKQKNIIGEAEREPFIQIIRADSAKGAVNVSLSNFFISFQKCSNISALKDIYALLGN